MKPQFLTRCSGVFRSVADRLGLDMVMAALVGVAHSRSDREMTTRLVAAVNTQYEDLPTPSDEGEWRTFSAFVDRLVDVAGWRWVLIVAESAAESDKDHGAATALRMVRLLCSEDGVKTGRLPRPNWN